jgi:hypothetical protein
MRLGGNHRVRADLKRPLLVEDWWLLRIPRQPHSSWRFVQFGLLHPHGCGSRIAVLRNRVNTKQWLVADWGFTNNYRIR